MQDSITGSSVVLSFMQHTERITVRNDTRNHKGSMLQPHAQAAGPCREQPKVQVPTSRCFESMSIAAASSG